MLWSDQRMLDTSRQREQVPQVFSSYVQGSPVVSYHLMPFPLGYRPQVK